jgi:CheY-like chemotaxis protein
VLFNLLSNSIKFTPPGNRITLEFCDARVANPREGEPSGELEEGVVFFRVTDTGIGIPEKQLHRLFKSFSQVDKSISRKFGGTGLGLAICKHLAHGMGGQIGVSSQHGKGSTFWFTAALPAASPWPYRQKLEAEKRERERDEGRSVLQGRRILVIDDNVINQKVAVKMLSSVGCDVVVASSGANALELLREEEELRRHVISADSIEAIDEVDDHYHHHSDHHHKPQQQPKHGFDAILCDIEMPELDGFGTAVKIREQERRFAASAAAVDNDGRGRGWQQERESRTPIIALSAFHSEEYRVRCRESGMSDYMSKPVKKDALVSCLAKWCNDPSALWRLIATCPLTSDDSDCSITSSNSNSNSNSDEEEEEEVKATLIGGSGDVPFECRPTA